jgi:succinyl-CoA synthetase beta subunit
VAKFLEFEAKRLLKTAGISTPRGRLASDVAEVLAAGEGIGYPVVLKAQIPTGKRGKAGAILFAATADEADQKASWEFWTRSRRTRTAHHPVCFDQEIAGERRREGGLTAGRRLPGRTMAVPPHNPGR